MIVRRAVAVWVTVVSLIMIAACIPLGRWQAHRALAAEQVKIERIASLVAPVGSRPATAYRLAVYDCLLYPVGHDPYAIELCFDQRGGLVEAIDRRQLGFPPEVGTVRYEASGAPVVIPPTRLLRLFHAAGALRAHGLTNGLLPGPFADSAPKPTAAGNRLLGTIH